MDSIRSPRRAKRATSLAVALAVSGLLVAPKPAWSSGIPVVDAGHIVAQITEFAKELQRYEEQVREWQNLLSQNPIQRLQESANLRPKIGNQLQMKSDTFGADQRCNRYGGGALGAIGNVFQISFDPNGNLREEQKKLCALQVALENRKWNENVLMIRQMELHQEKVDAAANARSANETQGEADTKAIDIEVAQGDFDANLAKGKARIETLDNMIASVEHMQSMAAQQLLAGSKPSGFVAAAASQIVQGAVLEAALEVNNDECGSRLGQRCD